MIVNLFKFKLNFKHKDVNSKGQNAKRLLKRIVKASAGWGTESLKDSCDLTNNCSVARALAF